MLGAAEDAGLAKRGAASKNEKAIGRPLNGRLARPRHRVHTDVTC